MAEPGLMEVPTEGFTYRLATDAAGNHGYEIGIWAPYSDFNDPRNFQVQEKCYGQQEAAMRTNALNMQYTPGRKAGGPAFEAREGVHAEVADEDEPPRHVTPPRHRK